MVQQALKEQNVAAAVPAINTPKAFKKKNVRSQTISCRK